MSRRAAIGTLLCALITPSLSAQASPDSAPLRSDCHQATQTIRTGSPRARLQAALALARICDGEARQLLIERWTTTVSDAAASDSTWQAISSTVEGLQDGRLLQSSLALASNRSLSLEARTWALSVAFSQIGPRQFLSPYNLRAIPEGHLCGGANFLPDVDIVQGDPLPQNAVQQVIDASAGIVATEGRESAIGRAADCVWRSATMIGRHQ